ncbi:MAG: hypothetical protein WKF96_14400 [Solirubrobacteraceae bacterium]
MATVSDTDLLRATGREPRLALTLTLKRTVAGLPSVAELASLIGAVTMIFELADLDGALRAAVRTPLSVQDALTGGIRALAVVEQGGAPMIITAGEDGALRSWHLDGTPGELQREHAHGSWITALGGLQRKHAYSSRITALAIVEHADAPLIISAGQDGHLRSWRLDGSPGEFAVDDEHRSPILALAVIEQDGAPMIITAGEDGALRSWHLDGTPGELQREHAHGSRITALAIVEHTDAPLIISAGQDGQPRSWRLDGSPGEFAVDDAHRGPILALAVVEHDGVPMIITAGVQLRAGVEGALRSWRLDGSPGQLVVDGSVTGGIRALAVLEHDGAPLIITAGGDATLRSWRLDGSRGELAVDRAHPGMILALAVVEHGNAPLIVSAGRDGGLRSWRVPPRVAGSLGGPLAAQLEVRRISLASPLEFGVLVPAMATVPAVLGFVLYAIKRLWTFPVELRTHKLEMRRKLREAEEELERLEATHELDDVVEAARDPVIRAWIMIDVTLSDDDG